MERRSYPRVQLPVLVELAHPSFGKKRSVARDVSEGGVFVHLENSDLKPGSKLKLTLLNQTDVESNPTPTVEMVVRRVEDNGIGLEFANKTNRHLWQSVERLREELEVGRDYFQIHQSAVVINQDAKILLVQKHGKWMFPGDYLIVGEDWGMAIKGFLASNFALNSIETLEILAMDSTGANGLPEAAVMRVFHLINADSQAFTMSERYNAFRWTNNPRALDEITFASDNVRKMARDILQRKTTLEETVDQQVHLNSQ